LNRKPGPGDVLLWHGSHDVLGTREPVILVEPAVDPKFWVVAELDEQGLPTPYTFAVPLEDLVPVGNLIPESSAQGTPWLSGFPARGALLRVAVSAAAAASFALGALSLVGHQPTTPIAEGLRPTPAAQVPRGPALRGSPRELRHQPSGSLQEKSSPVSAVAVGSRAGTRASAPALPSAVGGASGGGASGGGASGGGTGSGGTSRGGTSSGGTSSGGTDGGGETGAGSSVGSVATADTHPGNSGSAPGHDSTHGNSGSAHGHDSTHGNSGSAHGHNSTHGNSGSAPGHSDSTHGNSGSAPGHD